MTLIPELELLINEKFKHHDYRLQALKHWPALPEDWQVFLNSHLETYGTQWPSLRNRGNAVLFLYRHALVSLCDLDFPHLISFLGLTSMVGLDGMERDRLDYVRDKELTHLVPFFADVLRSRNVDDAEQLVSNKIVEAKLPALKAKTKRKKRKILSEGMRLRAIGVLPKMPYEGYVLPMYELLMRGLLRAGKRGANFDGLRWPEEGDDDGILRAHDGTPDKMRTDHVPDDHDAVLIQEIRRGSPFTKPGQLVIHDHRDAAEGRCLPPGNHQKGGIYDHVRFLAGIPDECAFDARAIRHRILTTAWANGATTDELRAIANHLPGSTVVETHYLEPLEVFEAAKFTDRILGVSVEHVCEACMINLMPYHRKCPRQSCGEPVPARAGGLQEASLDAYRDLVGTFEAAA